MEDWEGSLGEVSDTDINFKDTNNEDTYCFSGFLSKLQFRSDISKAQWNDEMRMAEVVEKKGKMWITTGIVRGSKTYCSIEETLFLVEVGALLLMDDNGTHLSLKDMYGKIADEKNGCYWELFEVYRHLKCLGYIVGRHGVPWTMKGVKTNCKCDSVQGARKNNGVIETELKGTTSIVEMLGNLQIDKLGPFFDVYLPNNKFKKSSPGYPTFLLCFISVVKGTRGMTLGNATCKSLT